MDSLLTSYHLDRATMEPFLQRESVLLSGSAALAMYLEQEGKAGFEPGDIDLWVSAMDEDTETELIAILREKGYRVAQVVEEADLYMERLTRIQRVVTLEHSGRGPRGKEKIQVIRVAAEDLKEYVVNHFDLSACMTWWDPEEERFETVYPALTLARQMFLRQTMISQPGSARLEKRVAKYQERGFTVVAEPPPFLEAADERKEADLEAWSSVTAFDVLAYEDVNAAEHLRGGVWNILVGCGGAWYAFERKALIIYMDGKRLEQGAILLFETPFRQYVGVSGWDSLAYSDDSVYRLVDPHDRVVNGQPCTIYTMETYSCAGWREGIPSYQHVFQEHIENEAEEAEEAEEAKEDLEINPQELQADEAEEERLALAREIDQIDQELQILLAPPDIHLYHQFLEWIHSNDI